MGNQGFSTPQGGGTAQNGSGTPQSGFMGAGAGQGGNGAQGAQNGSQGGAGETVSKADFDALMSRFEAMERDNKRYRDKARQQRGAATNDAQNAGNGRASADDGDGGESNVAAEVATLRTQLQTANFRTDITTAAVEAGCIIPGDLWRLVDRDSPEVDVDELGYVRNAKALVAELKKSKPGLFRDSGNRDHGANGAGNINGGAGAGSGNSNAPVDMNAGIRQALRSRRG